MKFTFITTTGRCEMCKRMEVGVEPITLIIKSKPKQLDICEICADGTEFLYVDENDFVKFNRVMRGKDKGSMLEGAK